MYEIAKQFDFCYGHRVWSQQLNKDFATDTCLACRHLHGHQGTIIIYLKGDGLKNGMVTDFKHLGWFKKWLDETLDHKFIMDLKDPLFEHEIPDVVPLLEHPEGHMTIQNLEGFPDAVREKYEGMVFVPFVPTSENLSKWIHTVVKKKMNKLNVTVSRVQFYETPKSQSNYYF